MDAKNGDILISGSIKIPNWFKIGVKTYLYGCTPAYEVAKIRENSWVGKDIFGDLALYPLDEVPFCWAPEANKENEPKLNAI